MIEEKAQVPDATSDHLAAHGISDSIKGKALEAKGKVEDAAGALTGDLKLQAGGKMDQAKGITQDFMGKVERSIDAKP